MSRNTTYTQYRSRPPSRPQSEQLVDLHVYVVPPDVWRDRFNNFLNQAVIETVSLGIIRVPPEARLVEIRQELVQQLEDLVPQDYVFLRSVGRSITRLKAKQEYQYKVKHFVRPQAYADELYLLEATPDLVASFTSRSQSPQSSRHAGGSQGGSPRLHRTHGYRPPETYQGYDDRYTQTKRREGGGGKGARGDDPRAATYTTNTNEDSGVAGLSPDDNNDDLFDRRKKVQSQMDRDKADLEREEELERQRRLRDLGERDLLDRNNWEEDAEERRRRQEEERRRRLQEDADRKRQAENDERNRHAQSDDDDDNRNDRSKKDRDNKLRRGSSDEELNRYPSPPPDTKTPTAARDTESARQSRKREKDKLLKELEAAKEERKHAEKEREELVKKAKQLQNKTQNRRNHARDVWKKRYFEEKKKTSPLEDQTNKLRAELDSLHKKLMASLEGPKQQRGVGAGTGAPSQRNNYVIQCTKLQHEIEDLRRRVENAKMKLTAEMKLRNQAEAELRALRAELVQKKINLTLTRNQHLAVLNPPIEPSSATPLPLVPSSMA